MKPPKLVAIALRKYEKNFPNNNIYLIYLFIYLFIHLFIIYLLNDGTLNLMVHQLIVNENQPTNIQPILSNHIVA